MAPSPELFPGGSWERPWWPPGRRGAPRPYEGGPAHATPRAFGGGRSSTASPGSRSRSTARASQRLRPARPPREPLLVLRPSPGLRVWSVLSVPASHSLSPGRTPGEAHRQANQQRVPRSASSPVGIPSTDAERSRAFYVENARPPTDSEGALRVLGGRHLLRHLGTAKMGMEFAPRRPSVDVQRRMRRSSAARTPCPFSPVPRCRSRCRPPRTRSCPFSSGRRPSVST